MIRSNLIANGFLVGSLRQILSGSSHIMDSRVSGLPVRTKYADGTPAHYLSRGAALVEYNILSGQVPINTLRPFPIKKSIDEIRWIYQKESNCLDLARDMGIGWWDAWDVGDNTIGIRYGETVRRHNLMGNLLDTFKNDPLSRRKIMSLWQEEDFRLDPKGLKPCAHTTTWSLNVTPTHYDVTVTLNQRSMDLLVTSSINPFQYYIMAEAVMAELRRTTGLPYRLALLRHNIDDVHIYDRHIPAALELVNSFRAVEGVTEVRVPMELDWNTWTSDDFTIIKPKVDPLKNPVEIAI